MARQAHFLTYHFGKSLAIPLQTGGYLNVDNAVYYTGLSNRFASLVIRRCTDYAFGSAAGVIQR